VWFRVSDKIRVRVKWMVRVRVRVFSEVQIVFTLA